MIRLLVGLAACVLATASHAAPFVSSPRPTIARASDVIEVPSRPIPVNTIVKFRRLDTPTAARIASQGFQVRLFRVSTAGELPRPENGELPVDDCDFYFSFVIGIGPSSGPEFEFANLDYSWLGLSSSRRTVLDGHFYAVLERSGVNDQIFRLRHADRQDYFKQGFSFDVTAEDRLLDLVRKHYDDSEDALKKLAAELRLRSDRMPCYQFVKVAGASGDAGAETPLETCSAHDRADPSGASQQPEGV